VFILRRLPALARPIRLLVSPDPLVVAALLLAAMLLAGCGGSSQHTTPSAPSRTGMESIFEAGPQLANDPAGTLDELRRLGVDRVKVFVPWRSIAPDPNSRTPPPHFHATDPAAYPAGAWDRYDAIVRDALARGIGVDLALSSPPPWAAGADAPDPLVHPWWKPSPAAFGAFVRAIGTRYSGSYKPPGSSTPLPRVGFWSIWNEPNYGYDLAPQAIDHSTIEVSPSLYRGLLDAAWAGLQATGHGHDMILVGETAPRGQTTGNHPGSFDGMVPLRFLRALYCVDTSFQQLRGTAAAQRGCPTMASGSAGFRNDHPALFKATGFAAHLYPQGGIAPNVVTQNEPDFADLASLPRLEQTLDRLQAAYGSSTRFPIYSTEFGYQTHPPSKIPQAANPETAAVYLNWSEYISWRDPRVLSYDQYLLLDPPGGNFPTGLKFKDGTAKATYAAYRLPIYLPVTSIKHGQQAEIWGCVRPARFARRDSRAEQRVRIQFRPASGAVGFKTVREVDLTDPYGYFDVRQAFDSSGTIRLAWSYPHHGATIFSRDVDLKVS
jgi:hypothetical protein